MDLFNFKFLDYWLFLMIGGYTRRPVCANENTSDRRYQQDLSILNMIEW